MNAIRCQARSVRLSGYRRAVKSGSSDGDVSLRDGLEEIVAELRRVREETRDPGEAFLVSDQG
jgi:hypothetical protein